MIDSRHKKPVFFFLSLGCSDPTGLVNGTAQISLFLQLSLYHERNKSSLRIRRCKHGECIGKRKSAPNETTTNCCSPNAKRCKSKQAKEKQRVRSLSTRTLVVRVLRGERVEREVGQYGGSRGDCCYPTPG